VLLRQGTSGDINFTLNVPTKQPPLHLVVLEYRVKATAIV